MITDPAVIETVLALGEVKVGDTVVVGNGCALRYVGWKGVVEQILPGQDYPFYTRGLADSPSYLRVCPEHIAGWERGDGTNV